MDGERWQQIKRLYNSALELEPDRREAFLQEACAGDESLRKEIKHLLAQQAEAEDLLGKPALEVAARALAQDRKDEPQPNYVGRSLLHYRITEKIGEGGMGVVYKARDTHLDRNVAIKMLPAAAVADPERKRRFIQEAKAASALNHPNIIDIHDINSDAGVDFIVMEHVPGKTLDRRIGRKGLGIGEALKYAVQIADALATAHAAGIVHRDLKPANIMVTETGLVKVLDFGLAKLTQPAQSKVSGTVSSIKSLTGEGRIIGTVAYMSPEQALGKELDARSDLFSLGVVLYEMATGILPFKGDTSVATFDAILHKMPTAPARLNPECPAGLEQIINRLLEKDRDLRYQHAADLRAELKRLKRDADSGRTPGMPAATEISGRSVEALQPHTRRKWAVAGLLLLLAGGAGVTWFARHQVQPAPQPELKQKKLTANPTDNAVLGGSISPDGKYLVYGDQTGIYLKVIETGETRAAPLPEGLPPGGSWAPVRWSPDGTVIYATLYAAGGRTSAWVMSVLGGPPRKLRDDADVGSPSPDGSQVLFLAGTKFALLAQEIWVMGAQGEDPRKLATAPENDWFWWPIWSPDGQRIAYLRFHVLPGKWEGSIESCDLKGGQPTLVVSNPKLSGIPNPWWLPDGRMLFTTQEPEPNLGNSGLWEIRVDSENGKPIDRPRRITTWAGCEAGIVSGTSDGKQIAIMRRNFQADVYLAELEATGRPFRNLHRLTLDDRNDFPSAWTPDSRSVLFYSDRNGKWDIFKQALDQNSAEPIVAGPGNRRNPVMSTDGSWILYLQDASDGTTRIMRVPVSAGPPQLVLEGRGVDDLSCARSPAALCVLGEVTGDRTQLVFTAFDPVGGRGRELTRVNLRQPVEQFLWRLSPDGSRIAFTEFDNRESRIQLLPLTGGEVHEVTVKGRIGLASLDWTTDGKGFFVSSYSMADPTLFTCDMQGRTEVLWQQKGSVLTDTRGIPAPNGRYLALRCWTTESNVWMLEGF